VEAELFVGEVIGKIVGWKKLLNHVSIPTHGGFKKVKNNEAITIFKTIKRGCCGWEVMASGWESEGLGVRIRL